MNGEPARLSGRLLSIQIILFTLFGLSLFAAWISFMALGFGGSGSRLSSLHLLMFAHWALPVLSGGSYLGLSFRRRWAWWTGLATFGLLGAMATLVAVQCVLPIRVLDGDPELWPLAAVYAVCALPGALLLRRGKSYLDLR